MNAQCGITNWDGVETAPGPGRRGSRTASSSPLRYLALAVLSGLMLLTAAPVLVATAASSAPIHIERTRGGELRNQTEEGAEIAVQTEDPTSGASSEEAETSAMVGILNGQGLRGAEALRRLAGIEVPNQAPMSASVIEVEAAGQAEAETAPVNAAAAMNAAAAAKVTRAAAAVAAAKEAATGMLTVNAAMLVNAMAGTAAEAGVNAAALAKANAARELDRAVAATVEARERVAEATSVAMQAAAKQQEADSRATEAAQATRVAVASQAAAKEQRSRGLDSVYLLLLALGAVAMASLGTMIWRRQQEPFVLKAKPAGS
jgi:hypothetical protein